MKEARSELTIRLHMDGDGAIYVSADGSGGRRPRSHVLGPSDAARLRGRLEAFTADIALAVEGGRPMGAPVQAEAYALYEALFQGEMLDVAQRLLEASSRGPILVRLMVRDPVLQAVPWEAVCEPRTHGGFLGTSVRMLLARGVSTRESCDTCPVKGTVRVLAIAPLPQASKALQALHDALDEPIKAGAVTWLPPIMGDAASRRHVLAKLRLSYREGPHVVHFLGHGAVDAASRPVLRLADGTDGEEEWIPAEALASELAASFQRDLRLVVLEACEGARPGAFGSAAEVLAGAGAQAVVAHLWPVKAEVARRCSYELYRSLTSAQSARGDVVASLTAARRSLLLLSAEAFSPVVYLRGTHATLFDFSGRTLVRSLQLPAQRPSVRSSGPPAISARVRRVPAIIPSPATAPRPLRAAPTLVSSDGPARAGWHVQAASRLLAHPTTVGAPQRQVRRSWHAWAVAIVPVIVTAVGVGVAQVASCMSPEPRDPAPTRSAPVPPSPQPTAPPSRPDECYGVKNLPLQCVGQSCKGRFSEYHYWNCDESRQVLLRCESSQVVAKKPCHQGCDPGPGQSDDQCR